MVWVDNVGRYSVRRIDGEIRFFRNNQHILNAEYIGRSGWCGGPTIWGNPYRSGRDGTLEEVLSLYKSHLWRQIQGGIVTINDLRALEGKILLCHCKPKGCHGDVLSLAVEWACNLEF